MLSCVIPTLNAAGMLGSTLAALAGLPDEVVIVDGGSTDGTVALSRRLGTRVIQTPPGRGAQLAAGIAGCGGDWLLLLHADTVLGGAWVTQAEGFMRTRGDAAGYFRFRLASADRRARRLERAVDWRCRRLGLPYGDQGLLLSRRLLQGVGGVRPLRLMEDVDLVRRLGRDRLVMLGADAVTSAARWERDGYVARSARNLCCLSMYFAGVPMRLIARVYG